MELKYWEIEIDGTDRVGKDTLLQYLCKLGGYRFSINPRGLLSQLVYTEKFGRDYTFDLSGYSKNKVIIWLYADKEDLDIRCKLTNEPSYTIIEDTNLFDKVYHRLEQEGYNVMKYNTSEMTPYGIAKDVLDKINKKEENK